MKEIVKNALLGGGKSLKQVCKETGLEKKKAKRVLRELNASRTMRDGTTYYFLKPEKKGLRIKVSPSFFEVDSYLKV